MKRTVFVQSEFLSDVQVLEIPAATCGRDLRPLLLQMVPQAPESTFVFVEDDDSDGAIDALAEIPEGLRVHIHSRKEVEVTVRYAGRQVRRTFRPSSTIARIKKWSLRELGISPSDGAELMLQVTGTDIRPDPDTHVGSLVKGLAKAVSFDLVPSPRVNG